MSTGKLTATVFMAGPEDKLGVVDVYDQASDSIVNSYQEQFHNVMDSLDGFLSGVSGFAKGLKGGLDFINSNLKLKIIQFFKNVFVNTIIWCCRIWIISIPHKIKRFLF